MVHDDEFKDICRWLGKLQAQVDSIEVTLRSREQMQPVDRQQDAALRPDELGRSAAGNPDGDWTEAFEAWLRRVLKGMESLNWERGVKNETEFYMLVNVLETFQRYKRRGAA